MHVVATERKLPLPGKVEGQPSMPCAFLAGRVLLIVYYLIVNCYSCILFLRKFYV